MQLFFKIRPSAIHGQGVFIEKGINRGEVFYEIPLERVSPNPHPRWAKIECIGWVNDPEVLNYINHSCGPNAELVVSMKPQLRALRDIQEGEEITVDYSLTEAGGVSVPCVCKDEACRGFFMRVE